MCVCELVSECVCVYVCVYVCVCVKRDLKAVGIYDGS